MNIEDVKKQIIEAVHKNTVDVLINTMAELRIENEQLKVRVAELQPKEKANP